MLKPYLLDETRSYAVVFKPPCMHSVPLKRENQDGGSRKSSEAETLLDWFARRFPPVLQIRGRKLVEGGILHRLDYDTQGLVLFAKTQASMDDLGLQQEAGLFLKEYSAVAVSETLPPLPGFPPDPPLGVVPLVITSAFRAYGPGRKAVRPVLVNAPIRGASKDIALDQGNPYQTEITAMTPQGAFTRFSLRITRGFRHQIRCHLAWIGHPILNDTRYGGTVSGVPPPAASPDNPVPGFLALIAQSISFDDPDSRERRGYTIEP
ncbi:MAG: RNA pseudouridine synthase [Treponema sp.]|jgi:23S rRNA pseudouridine1911/1915/1917 synthase|nr:RNA pseudouridine synthase [Treponema sp.]